jgi:hypothetical protein
VEWLSRVKKDSPEMFIHWRLFENQVG